MENRPTFATLETMSNNDLIRLRIMVDHVLFNRRVERLLPHSPSRSVARRRARQMTDAAITEKLESLSAEKVTG